jgi:multisubunit Na+/H+ antiporter MnhG subunit
MHERLVHLMVTLTFALLAFATFFLLMLDFSIGLSILLVLFMVLLIPYIMHYYLLENGVQRMYRQYDELVKKAEGKREVADNEFDR